MKTEIVDKTAPSRGSGARTMLNDREMNYVSNYI